MLVNDDCLNVLKDLPAEFVDLIYLDPPFFTQKVQKLKSKQGKEYRFSDIWKTRDDYLEYIRARLAEMKRVLKKTGSIFLHCDSSASWYLKLVLDDVFGENNFRSEIIWTYKRWSNSQKGLIPNHQTIFFYSKTSNFKFNTLYGDYSPTMNIDQILQERVRNSDGKTVYKSNETGEVVNCKAKKGVPLSDVWENPFLNPKAKERTGYPTQKPIELLDRLIRIATDKGDMVLDPFCGSGTTLVSAKLLGREYVGIDINPEAITLSQERLETPFKTESLLLKKGAKSYQSKNEKELSILNQFDCDIVQRNRGIDAFLKKHYNDAPVAIKIQKDSESLSESITLLKDAGLKKNCSFLILIAKTADDSVCVPENMIILSEYNSAIKQFLSSIK